MRIRSIRSTVVLGMLLSLVTLPAAAHEDLRLQAALASQPDTQARHYEKAQVYAQLGNLWTELGDEALSRELFQKSDQAAAAIDEPYVRNLLIGHQANELASTKQFESALATLDRVTDQEVWVKTAWKLVGKLAKAKQTEQAAALLKRTESIAQSISDHELRAELLSGTGASYRYLGSKHGENLVYEAFGIAQMLPDPYARAVMFNEAGAHLMDIGHRDLALEVFDRVDRLIAEISDPLKQAKALAMLGGEQAEKNERDRAALALERGRHIAATLPDGEDKFEVLSEIARNFGQSHRFETGIATADAISDPYHRAEGYIRIAKNMYRVGQKEEALALLARTEQLVPQVGNPYLRAVLLRKLASEQIGAGNREHARTLVQRAYRAIASRA